MLGQSNPILPTRLGRMARSAGYPTSGAFAGAMGISRPATGLLNAAAFLAGNPVNFPHLASVGPLYDKPVSRPLAQFPRAPSSDRNLTAGRTLAGPLSSFRRCRWWRAHRCNSLACTIEEGPQTLVRSDGSN